MGRVDAQVPITGLYCTDMTRSVLPTCMLFCFALGVSQEEEDSPSTVVLTELRTWLFVTECTVSDSLGYVRKDHIIRKHVSQNYMEMPSHTSEDGCHQENNQLYS